MYDLENIDLQVEKYIINKFISMPKLFESLGISYSKRTTMFCPFHYNHKTKSAKLYSDEARMETLVFFRS